MRLNGRGVMRCIQDAAFLEHFRCPSRYAEFAVDDREPSECRFEQPWPDITDPLCDLTARVMWGNDVLRLPFSPRRVVAHLRGEEYVGTSYGSRSPAVVAEAYYWMRPLLPVGIRRHLQRAALRNWQNTTFPAWPVDTTVERVFDTLMWLSLKHHRLDRIPFVWFWPEGRQSCVVMTHDVETSGGLAYVPELMDLDESYGIRSSFQLVPEERYRFDERFLEAIRKRGFEVNVHDLNHDGRLFSSREEFERRVVEINRYGREFKAEGFRSAVLYRRLAWLEALEFSYDMSVPNSGRLEAQDGGCCSILPFSIGRLVELPVTTTQDYALFHILRQYSIDLWKQQVARISERHGMANFIVHPDYVVERNARSTYERLLAFLKEFAVESRAWLALPGEVAHWWRQRNQMTLVPDGNQWKVEGPGSARARVGYASLDGNRISYRLQAVFLPVAWDDWSVVLESPVAAVVVGVVLIVSFFSDLFRSPMRLPVARDATSL